jgi:histidine triad (HIT) family protein
MGEILNQVSKALKVTESAEHVYCFVQGDAVPHLHVHVIPRYPNTPKEFWGPMTVKNYPQAPRGEAKEIIELCTRLKAFLTEIRDEVI